MIKVLGKCTISENKMKWNSIHTEWCNAKSNIVMLLYLQFLNHVINIIERRFSFLRQTCFVLADCGYPVMAFRLLFNFFFIIFFLLLKTFNSKGSLIVWSYLRKDIPESRRGHWIWYVFITMTGSISLRVDYFSPWLSSAMTPILDIFLFIEIFQFLSHAIIIITKVILSQT